MKLNILAAACLVALSATGAQALSGSTFDGGQHESFEAAIEAPLVGVFFKEYDFTLSGTYSLTATFASSGVVGSFGIYKSDDTPIYSWGVGGPAFTTSSTFSLDAGSYYYAVTGFGKTGGYILSSSAVAAVPEPETYAMLAAGLGIVGFIASRRRRND
jgi:PEP-CTERM motif